MTDLAPETIKIGAMDCPTGTVIHGTLRPQDLIRAFSEWLDYYQNGAFLSLIENYAETREDLVMQGDNDDPWLLDELFDAINEAIPSGFYFGAHPGDGSDFGIWENEEEE